MNLIEQKEVNKHQTCIQHPYLLKYNDCTYYIDLISISSEGVIVDKRKPNDKVKHNVDCECI